MVSFTLRQLTHIVFPEFPDDPRYQVINEVTMATDTSPAVYVFKASTQKFSHYASAADMASWVDSLEKAQVIGQAFYRLPLLTRTWETVESMNEDLAMSVRRLQLLANELTAQHDSLVIDRTTVIAGG